MITRCKTHVTYTRGPKSNLFKKINKKKIEQIDTALTLSFFCNEICFYTESCPFFCLNFFDFLFQFRLICKLSYSFHWFECLYLFTFQYCFHFHKFTRVHKERKKYTQKCEVNGTKENQFIT